MTALRNWIAELRRRHVFGVAAWYGGAAWLIIQVAATTFPSFGLPAWTVRATVVVVLLGFPVALVIAYLFDLTAGRLERTPSPVEVPPAARVAWAAPSLWLALGLGALLGFGALQVWREVVVYAGGTRPVVAVLPFTTPGGTPEDATLAAGLHESLIMQLARLGGLDVIARSSVEAYAGKPMDLRVIGRELAADAVMEGSLQHMGSMLRIQVQLVETRSNRTLWTELIERRVDDLFNLQSELARGIATGVAVNMSADEQRLIGMAPTANVEAYQAYLSALQHWPGKGEQESVIALSLFTRATELDPGFAVAHAKRAEILFTIGMSFQSDALTARAAAGEALDRALVLAPDDPEVGVAKAVALYRRDLDYPAAVAELERVAPSLPGNARIPFLLGLLYKRMGRWADALVEFERASRLDPRAVNNFESEGPTCFALRRFSEYLAILDRARAQGHNPTRLDELAIWTRFARDGDVRAFRTAIEAVGTPSNTLWEARMRSGDFTGARAVLESAADDPATRDAAWQRFMGITLLAAGNSAGARKVLEEMRARLAQEVDPSQSSSRARVFQLFLAWADLAAGDEPAVIADIERAFKDNPPERDAVWAEYARLERARLLAQIGDREEAIAAVAELLTLATPNTPGLVASDWGLVPLRDDPKFRELMVSYGMQL